MLGGVEFVYMAAFDLGAEIDAKKLASYVFKNWELAEALILQDKDRRCELKEEALKQAFDELKPKGEIASLTLEDAVKTEYGKLRDNYVTQPRNSMVRLLYFVDDRIIRGQREGLPGYVRLKLSNFRVSFTVPLWSHLTRTVYLDCEPDLLIRDGGICVLTVWIRWYKDSTLEELDKQAAFQWENNFGIIDSHGVYMGKDASLNDYARWIQYDLVWLTAALLGRPGFTVPIDRHKLREIYQDLMNTLRTPIQWHSLSMCVKTLTDGQTEVGTAEELMGNYPKQLAAMVTGAGKWRTQNEDWATRVLKESRVDSIPMALAFVGRLSAVWLSTNLVKADVEINAADKESSFFGQPELCYRRMMLTLVQLFSFLFAQRFLLEMLDYRLSQNKGWSLAKLSTLRDEVRSGLEEYYNIDYLSTSSFFQGGFEIGRKVMGLETKHDVILEKIESLQDVLNTRYDALNTRYSQRINALQLWLSILFGVLSISGVVQIIQTFALPDFLKMLLSSITCIAIVIILVFLVLRYGLAKA
jgi:hypothetical protein